MRMLKLLLPCLVFSLLWTSCKDDDMTGTDPCAIDFDQKEMFIIIADDLIVPKFQDFQTFVNALETATNTFFTDVNVQTHQALITALTNAWVKWQHIAQYSFGPAEEMYLRNSLNNFPLDETATLNKITTENYDFSSPDAYDKGFPALDYIFSGKRNTEAEIVEYFQTNENANLHKIYAQAIITDMKERTSHVIDAWNNGYRDAFVNNTGTAAGTSLSQIINGLNHNYELIKREKVGIPLGTLTLGITNPDNVEAHYTGISAQLIKEAISASKELYEAGLDDYLNAANAEKDGEKLSTLISNQFTAIETRMQDVIDPFSDFIENQQVRPIAEEAYMLINKNVLYLKTDLPSVLCVSITYIDNPSDSD